jgi:DNA-binding PadR family transcriptional regulator
MSNSNMSNRNVPHDLDDLDKLVLYTAYELIAKSLLTRRVAGSKIYETVASVLTGGISPPLVPSRIQRLVRKGLLEKDAVKSNGTTKYYAPTGSGLKAFKEMKDASAG